MRKNSLVENKGLSLSQAQSVSNLCHQGANEIEIMLKGVNNCSKTVSTDNGVKTLLKAVKMPENVLELLTKKCNYNACQAFLMENIKAKTLMLEAVRNGSADISMIEKPVLANVQQPNFLGEVNEEWGWEQLSRKELNEKFQVEAFAAHIGQFIHKSGTLSKLRVELPTIPAIEWMTIRDGEKSAIDIEIHHKSEDLLVTHNELSAEHRKYEQRVNYFKAKVKNLVTIENARIAKVNAELQLALTLKENELQSEYSVLSKAYQGKVNDIRTAYEITRQADISKIASMRIEIDERFKATVDEFINDIKEL